MLRTVFLRINHPLITIAITIVKITFYIAEYSQIYYTTDSGLLSDAIIVVRWKE